MVDLGRVYYQFLKHNVNGSFYFVIVKKFNENLGQNIVMSQSLKFCDIEKFKSSKENLSNSTNSNVSNVSNSKTDAIEDSFLFKHIKPIIEFDQNCENKLEKGLYVAYLKVQSNIEYAKIMVPYEMTNSLPYQKVRDNPFVSRYYFRNSVFKEFFFSQMSYMKSKNFKR